LGFMAGEISTPDDFDTLGSPEIMRLWEVVIKLELGREDFKVVDGCFHTNETGRIFMMKIKTKIDGMIIGLFL